ncbi:MAG TPA: SDR family oxidoreductase [Herpetosiphonaceae bacterium]
MTDAASYTGLEIAIVGMAGQFPGARNIAEFWENLRAGVESIAVLDDDDLRVAGVDEALLSNPAYVRSRPVLADADRFDAAFFGYSPREAEIMDPQQRVFLECAWQAIEDAGYDAEQFAGAVGVYAGLNLNTYLFNLYSDPQAIDSAEGLQALIGNDKDYLATRVSYKLGLSGPSVGVQTACSTSLVAVHLASRGLLSGECDLALAGGISISLPQTAGYLYQEGGLYSADGHCRAFAAEASGTVFGSGVGVVVLKRLQDALDDRDTIHAVIKGSAINNDGAYKVGFTAPSVQGQAQVIATAQRFAEVDPATISYVEAHGTGTPLGDPIEVAALTQAFSDQTQRRQFCALGSVKTNVGHLNAAAGVAGLIKTVLALKHQQLPPSLHFDRPNPNIDFAGSPFFVNAELRPWPTTRQPRRAGVSSFGVGGTNAHLIVEEAPPIPASSSGRSWHLLPISARTASALDAATSNLAAHLRSNPALDLADVAYTLQRGRRAFDQRRFVVCRQSDDAAHSLETLSPQRVFTAQHQPIERSVVFLFPGGGAQHTNMGRDLYASEPLFRETVDRCAALLHPQLCYDLRDLIFPDESRAAQATEQLKQTSAALPALFTIEYALAQLWLSWGVRPQAMIGHSLGEYVAACLADVLTLEDALALVVLRGKLFEQLPGGSMLSVALPAESARDLLDDRLSLAAINGPANCVIAGPNDAIEALAARLARQGVEFRRLQIDVAAHSQMVTPILEPFTTFVRGLKLQPPRIPYVSNVTGTWITADEATDPHYWARHLRQTVRFADGLHTLCETPERLLLEVGPAQTLTTLAKSQVDPALPVLASMRHPRDRQPDLAVLLTTLGKLWLSGIRIDWAALSSHEPRRVPLPTYPFERQRYWIDLKPRADHASKRRAASSSLGVKQPIADWFYAPWWQRSQPLAPATDERRKWLIFTDDSGLGSALVARLAALGHDVRTVRPGARFERLDDGIYTLDPRRDDDYHALLADLLAADAAPSTIVHAWSVDDSRAAQPDDTQTIFAQVQDRGYNSLLLLARALERAELVAAQGGDGELRLIVLASGLHAVTGTETIIPERAPLLGPCKTLPQEYPQIRCRCIDLAAPRPGTRQAESLITQLIAECGVDDEPVIAYRGTQRWVQTFQPLRLPDANGAVLRERGVYLITGGLGRVGLLLAEHLARTCRARLALVGRAALPPRDEWERWLNAEHAHPGSDAIREQLRAVQRLEQFGAEVLPIQADVADLAQVRAAIERVEQHFGALHGVLHAAGPGVGPAIMVPIAALGRSASETQFAAKVEGAYALDAALSDRALDFCLLFSSNAAVLGGLGLTAFAAANLFLDAFAISRNATSATPWISVSWDSWPRPDETALRTGIDQYAMTADEATAAFDRVLGSGMTGQIVCSTGDLDSRLDLWIRHALSPEPELAQAAPALHARPTLGTAYAPPGNEIERAIIAIWQELLGIQEIGVHDQFFELGGHSLLASRAVARLREAFQVELSLRAFFDAPTPAELADAIAQLQLTPDDEDLALLAMIEQLEDDQVDAELIRRLAQANR